MIFCPPGFDLYVDNPGYGEVIVLAVADPDESTPLVDQDWTLSLYGPEIGEFLTQVTGRALGTNPTPSGGIRLPEFLTAAVARTLLPALQEAVVLAVAGTDRYERTFPDPGEHPPAPLCVHCNLGTYFTPGALRSAWCDEYGHRAYGVSTERWETAQEIHQIRAEAWQRDRRRTAVLRTGPVVVDLDDCARDVAAALCTGTSNPPDQGRSRS
jgi:hypothetical protein